MSMTPEEKDAAWEKLVDESESPAEMFEKAEDQGLVQLGDLGQSIPTINRPPRIPAAPFPGGAALGKTCGSPIRRNGQCYGTVRY